MSHHTDFAKDEAASWVARMDSDRWSAADEVALQAWLDVDHRHRGLLLHTQAAWLSLDSEQQAGSRDRTVRAPSHGLLGAPARRRVLAAGGALAASLVMGALWLGSASTYSTELGEIRKIPLADGSSATINSSSKIDVRLAKQLREVRLEQGEAWFQVAKDRSRPFQVEAGAVIIQAVGTAFSVRRRDHGAEIIVTEGVVEGWAAQADGHRTRITAGQHAFIGDNAAIRLVSDKSVDVARTLAWRTGSIDLRGRALTDAIEEFNRYNRRKLVLEEPKLAGEQFDGIFRTDDPEGFADAVSRSFGVPLELRGSNEIRIGGQIQSKQTPAQ